MKYDGHCIKFKVYGELNLIPDDECRKFDEMIRLFPVFLDKHRGCIVFKTIIAIFGCITFKNIS